MQHDIAWRKMLAICASLSDPALLLVNRLKTIIFFVNVPLKLLSPEAYSAPPDSWAGFEGPTSKGMGGEDRMERI